MTNFVHENYVFKMYSAHCTPFITLETSFETYKNNYLSQRSK